MSPSSDAALAHLRKIKPNDGWSIEQKEGLSRLVRLLRRNVPVTDSYFLDIHYDASGSQQVVGILTGSSSSSNHSQPPGKVQAQVLVDRSGRPATGSNKVALVSISNYPVVASGTRSTTPSSTATAAAPSSSSNPATLTDAQNRDVIFYGASAIMAAIVFRIVLATAFSLSILLVPAGYLYLVYTCPTADTFDAKKELKRILRGHHLPENHPDKPHGMLSEALARIQATVTTELATLPGYEVTTIGLAGAVTVACTRVPAVHRDFYWIGICHQWWYVYGVEMKNDGRAD